MTERVTRDKEFLAAWPESGRCWKLVDFIYNGSTGERSLRPLIFPGTGWYHEFGKWVRARDGKFSGKIGAGTLAGFHCFQSLKDALRAREDLNHHETSMWGTLLAITVQEFEYRGLRGVGAWDRDEAHGGGSMHVLLVEWVKPLPYVTLPDGKGGKENDYRENHERPGVPVGVAG